VIDWFQDRKFIVLLALVIVVTIAAHVLPSPRTIDDAFITFRYSRNINAGEGFVYNPGVYTLGTTTPLYTLLMSAISAITGAQDYPWYALTVNALAAAGTATCLFLLLRRLTGSAWLGALIGILWGISPISVAFSVGGMETSLNIFWFVGAVYFFVTDRRRWLGLFVGLAFLTRIDTVIWIGPLLLHQLVVFWWQHRDESLLRRIPWTTWIMALVVVLPWMIFAFLYFGSPVPNSIAAKSVVYAMQPGAAFVSFFRAYVVPFSDYQLLGSVGVMLASPFYLIFILTGIVYIYKHERRLLPFVIYPWLYMAAFSIANPLVFRWYVAPPLPALIFGIIVGAWTIAQAVQNRIQRLPVVPLAMAGLSLLWISASIAGWTAEPDHGPQRPAPEMAWHQQELYYREMVEMLVNEYGVTEDTPVAAPDIGVIGYVTNSRIIDPVGLIDPGMAPYYPVDKTLIPEGQNYAIPPQIIFDRNPAYLVTMEAAVRLGLEMEPAFQAAYELVYEIPTDFYGTGMRLYADSE